jgi:CRP-like cAMP-binding protein
MGDEKEYGVDVRRLTASALFSSLAMKEVKTVLKLVPHVAESYALGDVIVHQRKTLGKVGILLEGAVAGKAFYYGGSLATEKINGTNDLLGLEGAISEGEITSYQIAVEQECRILWFDWNDLLTLEALPHQIRAKILRNCFAHISDNMLEQILKVDILSEYSIKGRVMKFLNAMAKENGTDTFTINMDQKALAAYLHVNRTSLTVELSKLRKEGIIDYRREPHRKGTYTVLKKG